ncbi:MAG: ABC transporter substrate-binding protein [Fervidicoccaceae archaeon]|jgi:iron complex transport system substrate-binding protein
MKNLLLLGAIIIVVIAIGAIALVHENSEVTQQKNFIIVTDGLGRNVTVPLNVTRVVVLDQGSAEIVYSLGAGSLIVGRLDSMNFPPSILNATPLTYTNGVDLEKLVSLHPDIIITYIRTQQELQSYESHNLTVIGVPWTNSIQDLYNMISMIGKALNRENRASYVISYLNSTVNQISTMVSNSTSKPRVLFIRSIGTSGIQIVTQGIENQLITLAGGISLSQGLSSNASTIFINYEDVVKMNPDIIVLSFRVSQNVSDVLRDSRLQNINAVKNGQVFKIPREYTPTSPRFVLLLAYLAKIIHPNETAALNMTSLRLQLYRDIYGLSDSEISMIK